MALDFLPKPKHAATLLWGGVAILVCVLLLTLRGGGYPTHLSINEVSFANNDGDWVELYNPTLSGLSLKGYYLSDNRRRLTRYSFSSDTIIPSHGFLVLYGENYTNPPEGAVVLPFSIGEGETVYLVAADGRTIVDSMTTLGSDAASVGRFPDGSQDLFTFSTATLGAPNQKDHGDMQPMNRR